MAIKSKKFLKLICLKIPIIIGIILLVLIAALKLVERSPEPLKQGLEQYLSESTGTNATIEKMEKFAFFPNVDIQIKKLTLHNASNAAKIDLSADQIELIAPISSALFSKNKIKNISIENLEDKIGMLLPKPFVIESASIIDQQGPDQYGSFFIAKGSYNNQKMTFEAKLIKKGSNYIVPKDTSFSLNIGAASVNAILAKGFLKVVLKDTIFSYNGKQSNAKEYMMIKSKRYYLDNPLSCVVTENKVSACQKYLEEEN